MPINASNDHSRIWWSRDVCWKAVASLTLAASVWFNASTAVAEIVISEIMYNPQGADRSTGVFDKEWVEIYNAGQSPIDLAGWTLEDVQDSQVSSAFPSGTMLAANESLVLTGDATTFDEIWGADINRLQVSNFPVLSNSPSPTNETIGIRDSSGNLRDLVNYDDSGTWPTDDGPQGASIFLEPTSLSTLANNSGTSWLPSMAGVYGSRFVSVGGSDENHGSPGFVGSQSQLPIQPSPDASWSMVVIPDTQNYAKSSINKVLLNEMTQWIAANQADWNIQLVLQEGDLVNNNDTASPTSGDQNSTQQWQNVKNAFRSLDGVVPYVLATGNHDHGTTNAQNRATEFNNYFTSSDNSLVDPTQGGVLKGVLEPGRLENAYYELEAPDGRELLVVSLEWGPRQAAVDWANQVVGQSKYDDHTAILLTHAYMYHDETRYDIARNLDADPDNNQGGNPHSYQTADDTHDGGELWNELVKLHGNFEFVFSGHVGGDGLGRLASTGDEGNLVHQMLFNTQFESTGGNGWLRLVEFLDDGQTVRVRTFSPHYDLQKTDEANNFTLQISSVASATGDFNLDGTVDGDDFLLWQRGGSPTPLSAAELAVWQAHFGDTVPSASSLAPATIPEPSTLVLLALLGIADSSRIGSQLLQASDRISA